MDSIITLFESNASPEVRCIDPCADPLVSPSLDELNTELLKEPVRADLMYTVTWGGVQMGFHIEFQKRNDTNHASRGATIAI